MSQSGSIHGLSTIVFHDPHNARSGDVLGLDWRWLCCNMSAERRGFDKRKGKSCVRCQEAVESGWVGELWRSRRRGDGTQRLFLCGRGMGRETGRAGWWDGMGESKCVCVCIVVRLDG